MRQNTIDGPADQESAVKSEKPSPDAARAPPVNAFTLARNYLSDIINPDTPISAPPTVEEVLDRIPLLKPKNAEKIALNTVKKVENLLELSDQFRFFADLVGEIAPFLGFGVEHALFKNIEFLGVGEF